MKQRVKAQDLTQIGASLGTKHRRRRGLDLKRFLRLTRFNPQTHSVEMERYRLVNPYCVHHSAIVHYSHTTGI